MSDLLARIDLRFDLVQQQLARYEISDNGCWEFTGPLHAHGYGRFTIYVSTLRPKKRKFVASRVAYAYYTGEDPGARLVCHVCDNPRCINPDHLFLGTPKDNAQDREQKGRGANQKGENNPSCKINAGTVLSILDAIRAGKNNKQIAAEYSVSHSQVSLIRLGKSWSHLSAAADYNPSDYRKFTRGANHGA